MAGCVGVFRNGLHRLYVLLGLMRDQRAFIHALVACPIVLVHPKVAAVVLMHMSFALLEQGC